MKDRWIVRRIEERDRAGKAKCVRRKEERQRK